MIDSPPAGGPVADPGASDSLPRGITALDAIDPVSSDADLAAFDATVGSVEVIGLGENVHTSGGFHRARVRLVRHMVEKLGFRAVALETPWADAQVATRWFASAHRQGRPRNITLTLRTWRTRREAC